MLGEVSLYTFIPSPSPKPLIFSLWPNVVDNKWMTTFFCLRRKCCFQPQDESGFQGQETNLVMTFASPATQSSCSSELSGGGLCDPPYYPLLCLAQSLAHTVFTLLPRPLYCRAQFRLWSAFVHPITMAPRLIALSLPSAESSLWAEGLKTPVLILHNDSPFFFSLAVPSLCCFRGFL